MLSANRYDEKQAVRGLMLVVVCVCAVLVLGSGFVAADSTETFDTSIVGDELEDLNATSAGEPDTPPVYLDKIHGNEGSNIGHVTSQAPAPIVTDDLILTPHRNTSAIPWESLLEAYDHSGENQWEYPVFFSGFHGAFVQDDVVYVVTSLDPQDSQTQSVVALDLQTGDELWNTTATAPDIELFGDAAFGEHIYVTRHEPGTTAASDTSIHALDFDNGTEVWSKDFEFNPTNNRYNTADDERLYFVRDDQILAVNGTTGERVWDWEHWSLSDDISAQPTVADGMLYVPVGRNSNALYAIDAETGFAEWRVDMDDVITHSPVVEDDTVYVSSGMSVFALTDSGEKQARYRTNGTITDLIYGEALHVASEDGSLHVFDDDLDRKWSFDLPPDENHIDSEAFPRTLAMANETLAVSGSTSPPTGSSRSSLYVFKPTALSVTDLDVDSTSAAVGETVTATATVTNDGAASAEATIAFEIDGPLAPERVGVDRQTETVTVDANGEATVSTTVDLRSSGSYEITAFEDGTGGLDIEAEPSPVTVSATYEESEDDWLQPLHDEQGSLTSQNTTAPAEPVQEVWSFGDDIRPYSNSVIVEDGTVFVHNESRVFAVDMETGVKEWSYKPPVPSERNDRDTNPATVRSHLVDDGVVYILAGYGTSPPSISYTRVYAVNATDGEGYWERGSNNVEFREFGNRSSRHDTELLLVDDRLVFPSKNTDRDSDFFNDGLVLSLDSTDGGNALSTHLPREWFIEPRASDEHILVKGYDISGNSRVDHTLYSLDAETLELTDSRTFEPSSFRHVTDNDTVYVSYANLSTEAMEWAALSPANLSEELWTTAHEDFSDSPPLTGRGTNTFAVTDELLIAGHAGPTEPQGMHAIDLVDGEIKWYKIETGNAGRPVVVADGTIFARNSIIDHDTGEHLTTSPGQIRPQAVSDGTILSFRGSGPAPLVAYQETEALEVSELALSEEEVDEGSGFTIEANLEITNPSAFTQDVGLEVRASTQRFEKDGDSLPRVVLEPNETRTFTLEYTDGEPGTLRPRDYAATATVNARNFTQVLPTDSAYRETTRTSSFSVTEHAVEPEQPTGVLFTDREVAEDQVPVGEPVVANATLYNIGNDTDSLDVNATLGPLDDGSETVSVPPETFETVSFELLEDEWYWNDVEVVINDRLAGIVDILDYSIGVSDTTLSATEVGIGEELDITATAQNFGNIASDETPVNLTKDGDVIASEPVSLDPSASTTVEFTESFDEAGVYELAVGDDDSQELTVSEGEADIGFEDLSVTPGQISTGNSVNVTATVANDDIGTGAYNAPLEIDGQETDFQTGVLTGHESETVTFSHQFDEAGTYDVTVGDLPPQQVTVTAAWSQFRFGDDNVAYSNALLDPGQFEFSGPGPDGHVGQRWNESTDDAVVSSPAAATVGTANGMKQLVFVGSDDGTVYAFDQRTGEEEWNASTDGAVRSSPAVFEETVYVGSNDSSVYALDATDGTEHWSTEVGDSVRSSPVVADGTLYVGSDDGSVYALDVTNGSEVWEFETGDSVQSSPAVADGVVYVGSDDTSLYAIDAADGTEEWSMPTGGPVVASPVVDEHVIYVASTDNNVYAMAAGSGESVWTAPFETDDDIVASPALRELNDKLYVASMDETVYAVNTTDGTEEWNASVDAPVQSSPASGVNNVIVGTDAGSVYALNALHGAMDNGGELVWELSVGETVRSSPAILDGAVYVGDDDSGFYAISEKLTVNDARVVDGVAYEDDDGNQLIPPQATVGQDVTVEVNVTNDGVSDEYLDLALGADGFPFYSDVSPIIVDGVPNDGPKQVSVGAGETEEINVTFRFLETPPGPQIEFTINQLSAGQLGVLPPEDAEMVVEGSVDKTRVDTEENVTVTTEVENTGSDPGSIRVTPVAGGEQLIDDPVETFVFVEDGETETLEFTHSFELPGAYEVELETMQERLVDDTPTVIESTLPVDVVQVDGLVEGTDFFDVELDDNRPGSSFRQNETGEFVANVSNIGEDDGTQSIDLTVAETSSDLQNATDPEVVATMDRYDQGGFDFAAWNVTDIEGAEFEQFENQEDHLDPELTLVEGVRYTIVNEQWEEDDGHPLGFLDENGTFLLGQNNDDPLATPVNGTYEDDAAVDWVDTGQTLSFTVTKELADEVVAYNSTRVSPDALRPWKGDIQTVRGPVAQESHEEFEILSDDTRSTEFTFLPGDIEPGEYYYEIASEDTAAESSVTVLEAEAIFLMDEADLVLNQIDQGDEALVQAAVFNIGESEGTKTLTLFANGEERTSMNVTIPAEESEFVTLTEQFNESGTYDLMLNDESLPTLTVGDVDEPATFLVDITDTNSPVDAGETLDVDVEVTNDGDENDTQDIILEVDGTEEDSVEMELDGEENKTETLTYDTDDDDVGDLNVTVTSEDDTASETVTVSGDAFFSVEVVDAPESVPDGKPVEVNATVENTESETDTQDIVFEVEGTAQDEVEMTLDGGQEKTEMFTHETLDEDVGDIEVTVVSDNDADSATVTIEHSVVTYADENGTVDTGGLLDGIDHWRGDDIDTELLLDVIDKWRSGESVF